MQFYERGVVRGIEILHAGAGDIACARVGGTQVNFHAVENRLVILQVRRKQVVVRLALHLAHEASSNSARVAAHVIIRLEVCRNREHEHCGIRALHVDVAVRNRDRAAIGHHVQAVLELDGVDSHVVNERVAVIRHLVVAMWGCHGRPEAHRAALVGREAHHNHVVRVARKVFAGVLDSPARIGRFRDGRLEVQFAAVIRGP